MKSCLSSNNNDSVTPGEVRGIGGVFTAQRLWLRRPASAASPGTRARGHDPGTSAGRLTRTCARRAPDGHGQLRLLFGGEVSDG